MSGQEKKKSAVSKKKIVAEVDKLQSELEKAIAAENPKKALTILEEVEEKRQALDEKKDKELEKYISRIIASALLQVFPMWCEEILELSGSNEHNQVLKMHKALAIPFKGAMSPTYLVGYIENTSAVAISDDIVLVVAGACINWAETHPSKSDEKKEMLSRANHFLSYSFGDEKYGVEPARRKDRLNGFSLPDSERNRLYNAITLQVRAYRAEKLWKAAKEFLRRWLEHCDKMGWFRLKSKLKRFQKPRIDFSNIKLPEIDWGDGTKRTFSLDGVDYEVTPMEFQVARAIWLLQKELGAGVADAQVRQKISQVYREKLLKGKTGAKTHVSNMRRKLGLKNRLMRKSKLYWWQ